MVARRRYFVAAAIVVALMLAARAARPAAAQNGACPTGTVQYVTPLGTWPDGALLCVPMEYLNEVHTISQPNLPCGQMTLLYNQQAALTTEPEFYIVPPITQPTNGWSRVRFYVWPEPLALGTDLPPNATVTLDYYTPAGVLQARQILNPENDANFIITTWEGDDNGQGVYYNVYVFDIRMWTNITAGTFKFKYAPNQFPTLPNNVYFASIQVGREDYQFPDTCEIPHATLPGTPTPWPTSPPTSTPTGTWVAPTPTTTPPSTPAPTAPGGTPLPTAVPSPIVFPTVPAENTPTPWAALILPTISWPEPPPTEVWGGVATPTPGSGGAADGLLELVGSISASYSQQQTFAGTALDTTSSDATGVAAPSNIVIELIRNIARPFQYIQALIIYLPNTAPYLLFLLLAAAWVFFNLAGKYALSIIARLLEIIRRLIELIPGM